MVIYEESQSFPFWNRSTAISEWAISAMDTRTRARLWACRSEFMSITQEQPDSAKTLFDNAFAEGFADKIPAPVFQVGVSKVRWKPMPTSDWGIVMGMRYIWAEHLASWQWQYYIILDPSSPSYEWTQADWGWQDDLELLPSHSSSATQLVEEVTKSE